MFCISIELRQRSVQQRSPPSSQIRSGMTPHLPVRTPHPGSIRPGVTPYGPRPGSQGIQPRTLMVTPQVNGFGKLGIVYTKVTRIAGKSGISETQIQTNLFSPGASWAFKTKYFYIKIASAK